MTTPHFDDPIIYEWDLNENSTRFERLRAWSSPEVLRIKFSIGAAVNAFVATACFVLVLAILTSPKLRYGPFNYYLLFIAIPDFLAAFLCFLTCAMSAVESAYYSDWMCGFQAFYLTWGFTVNAWLNAVIIHEIHKLLRYSRRRKRYKPPMIKRVCAQSAIVYAYAFAWGLLGSLNIDGFPLSSHTSAGFSCFPADGESPGQTWFFFFVFVPFFMMIPSAYSFGVAFHIYWYRLMPPEGKRRKIAVFMLKVVFLYFFIWMPFMLVGCVGMFVHLSHWFIFATSLLSHLQGFMTTLLCYCTDEDIKSQVNTIARCGLKRRPLITRFRSSLFRSFRMSGVSKLNLAANQAAADAAAIDPELLKKSTSTSRTASGLERTSSVVVDDRADDDDAPPPLSPGFLCNKNNEEKTSEDVDVESNNNNKPSGDALTWIRNGMQDADDPTGEYKRINRLLPTKQNQRSSRRASDIQGCADWMRNMGMEAMGEEEEEEEEEEGEDHHRHIRFERRHTSLETKSQRRQSTLGTTSQRRRGSGLFGLQIPRRFGGSFFGVSDMVGVETVEEAEWCNSEVENVEDKEVEEEVGHDGKVNKVEDEEEREEEGGDGKVIKVEDEEAPDKN